MPRGVIAWDGETFKEKSRRPFRPRVAAVAISPDGKTLAVAAASPDARTQQGEATRRWCSSGSRPIRLRNPPATMPAGPSEGRLSFAPDGKSLAVAFANSSHL